MSRKLTFVVTLVIFVSPSLVLGQTFSGMRRAIAVPAEREVDAPVNQLRLEDLPPSKTLPASFAGEPALHDIHDGYAAPMTTVASTSTSGSVAQVSSQQAVGCSDGGCFEGTSTRSSGSTASVGGRKLSTAPRGGRLLSRFRQECKAPAAGQQQIQGGRIGLMTRRFRARRQAIRAERRSRWFDDSYCGSGTCGENCSGGGCNGSCRRSGGSPGNKVCSCNGRNGGGNGAGRIGSRLAGMRLGSGGGWGLGSGLGFGLGLGGNKCIDNCGSSCNATSCGSRRVCRVSCGGCGQSGGCGCCGGGCGGNGFGIVSACRAIRNGVGQPYGDLPGHRPYETWRNYYYYRPYNAVHYRDQQSTSCSMGFGNEAQPYTGNVFEESYRETLQQQLRTDKRYLEYGSTDGQTSFEGHAPVVPDSFFPERAPMGVEFEGGEYQPVKPSVTELPSLEDSRPVANELLDSPTSGYLIPDKPVDPASIRTPLFDSKNADLEPVPGIITEDTAPDSRATDDEAIESLIDRLLPDAE